MGTFREAFWERFGILSGTFWGPERAWKKMPYKRGGGFLEAPVFANFWKQMKILGHEKGSQIGPKRAPKKVGQKDT